MINNVKRLVADKVEPAVMSREEVLDDFKASLEELKRQMAGKKEFTTWEAFRNELQEEGYFD